MPAGLPPTVNKRLLLAIKSKWRVVKGIEQMRCRAIRFARDDGKFAANVATPLQYAQIALPQRYGLASLSFLKPAPD